MSKIVASARLGKQTIAFRRPPAALGFASIVGSMEGDGPLGGTFDVVEADPLFGEKTWEKAESRIQETLLALVTAKAGVALPEIDVIYAGDLLNQCVGSAFGLRASERPFIGLYGACSTMAESLLLAAMATDGGYARKALALTSSHFCSAERQYRMPLEYGGQRTPTAQWTVTGAGAVILGDAEAAQEASHAPRVTRAVWGRIVDAGITDAANMGAAMAPAAHATLSAFFEDTDSAPSDYDLIATGDLGHLGQDLLRDLFLQDGVDLGPSYVDCGALIYDRETQDVHAGGSGCGCSASVLSGYLLAGMQSGQWRRLLFAGTGALLSPVTTAQGESIPSICHLVEFSS